MFIKLQYTSYVLFLVQYLILFSLNACYYKYIVEIQNNAYRINKQRLTRFDRNAFTLLNHNLLIYMTLQSAQITSSRSKIKSSIYSEAKFIKFKEISFSLYSSQVSAKTSKQVEKKIDFKLYKSPWNLATSLRLSKLFKKGPTQVLQGDLLFESGSFSWSCEIALDAYNQNPKLFSGKNQSLQKKFCNKQI